MSNLPEQLKYTKSHEWAKLESDSLVRVGITDFAQQELGDLVFVELPEVGKTFDAEQACAVVESVKTASDLNAPVSGEIVEINERLQDEPGSINDDPYETWIFCIKADNLSELDLLLDADKYQKIIED
ncbi:MAG: glycine cleavage system protein GcvH [Methylococcales bacterium]